MYFAQKFLLYIKKCIKFPDCCITLFNKVQLCHYILYERLAFKTPNMTRKSD